MENIEREPNTEGVKAVIDFPVKADIQDILDVQNSRLLKNKDPENPTTKESGFLVNEVGESDLDYAIDHNLKDSFLIVAKNSEGRVVGYFLAYDMEKFLKENPAWLQETGLGTSFLLENKVLYGKHVASDKTIPGVGRELDKKLFELAKQNGYTLYVGEICEGPIVNQKSLDVHTGEEFLMRKIGQRNDKDGYTWGVYAKNL